MEQFKYQIRRFWKLKFSVGNGHENKKKLRLFSMSFTVAILLFIIFIWIFSGNPFEALIDALKNFFKAVTFVGNFDRAVTSFSIIALSGIAIAIGYRAHLFNIGVSGQMMMSGGMAGVFALNVGNLLPPGIGQIIIVVMSMVFGACFALIAGLLKVYFRIHEVVTTILLNWIAFFFLQLAIKSWSGPLQNGHTVDFNDSFILRVGGRSGYAFVPVLVILFVTAFGTWFLFKKTVVGYRMEIVGKNKDAAFAAGINVRAITIFSLAFSGAVAGLLGAVVYFARDLNLHLSFERLIPVEGFSGIAISLLAFNNPLGVLPVAFLFSILEIILDNTRFIDPIFNQLALGLLMFFAAINILFERFHTIDWIRKKINRQKFNAFKTYRANLERVDVHNYGDFDHLKADYHVLIIKQKGNKETLKKEETKRIRALMSRHWKEIKAVRQAYRLQRTQLASRRGGQ